MKTNFITVDDYSASIRLEFVEKAARGDENILEIVENQAVAEMKSYLSGRYDVDAIFSASGDDRHDLVLMFAKDISIYHLCSIREGLMTQTRIDRYERAVKWLTDVRDGKLVVEGLPRLEEAEQVARSEYLMKSDPKRVNKF
ncbi:MAG: DUF1320 domain-containing protein [Bacteroidales bacterium]|nr:DUF1320 domain-containing protein [Bacteroidales bacterium]